jgi:protein-tyrosine phosphatase
MKQKNNNILFVCTGNTCRSPFAQAVFNAQAQARGLACRAESCGLAAMAGQPPFPEGVQAAARLGYQMEEMRSRPCSQYLLEWADEIHVMSLSHLAALQSAGPEIAAKARLLAEQGIPDPFGGGPQAYDRAYAAIEQAVKALLDRLEQEDGQ